MLSFSRNGPPILVLRYSNAPNLSNTRLFSSSTVSSLQILVGTNCTKSEVRQTVTVYVIIPSS